MLHRRRIDLPVFALIATLCGGLHPAQCLALDGGTNTSSLGPYLQMLSPDSVVVHWHTPVPAFGWVEYGDSPNLGRRQTAVEHGLRAANITRHQVRLSDLPAGRTLWYQVRWRPIVSMAAYKVEYGPEEAGELTPFETPRCPDEPLRVVVFNDLHNNTATFERLLDVVGSTDFAFSLFNGDCLADPASEETVLPVLAAFTKGVRAAERPAFFLRGNHETRGAYARHLPRLFSWPRGQPYFAFTAGPVRWLLLDCGEDKSDDHAEYSGLVDFEGFRREQAAWLREETASAPFREARWRILVHHIPLYSERPNGGFHAVCRELWGEVLADANIDLALNAHTHRPAFHPANSIGNPYPIAVGGGPGEDSALVMVLDIDPQDLTLRMLNTQGAEVFPPFHQHRP